MGGRWIVVQTQPSRELWAAENIMRLGAELYFPKISEVTRAKRGSSQLLERIRPLFPRYLFVNIIDQWRFLLGTWGVSGIIMGTNGPATLPTATINQLRAREDQNGLVTLPQLSHGPIFVPGQSLRVMGGVFSGYVGIHQGSTAQQRQRMLLDYMGRKVPVLIADELLEVA